MQDGQKPRLGQAIVAARGVCWRAKGWNWADQAANLPCPCPCPCPYPCPCPCPYPYPCPCPAAALFSGADRPVVPLAFSFGLDCGHSGAGGTRRPPMPCGAARPMPIGWSPTAAMTPTCSGMRRKTRRYARAVQAGSPAARLSATKGAPTATQPDRDHARQAEGLAPHRHTRWQVRHDLPLRRRRRHKRHLVASKNNEAGALVQKRAEGVGLKDNLLLWMPPSFARKF